MKKVYLSILIFVFSFFGETVAQIPNAGFENWTGTMPDNWISSSGNAYVVSDSNAHSGFLAVRLQTVQGNPVTTSTFFTRVSPGSSYYPTGMSSQPVSIGFWAITNFVNGDILKFNTTLKNSSNTIVATVTGTCVTTHSPTYQYYSFPFTYSQPGSLADSSATWFSFVNNNCVPNLDPIHNGSFAIIDDIGFDNTTEVSQLSKQKFACTVYPNPASDYTTVYYLTDQSGGAEILMSDMTGRKIMNTIESKGNNSFPIDLAEVPNGIYIISVVTSIGNKEIKLAVSH